MKDNEPVGVVSVDDLDRELDHYTSRLGYRLDMICPADAPTIAVVSKDRETVRLEQQTSPATNSEQPTTNQSDWVTGRAGMQYRDLVPDRLGGKIIASHIRLPIGGEVPDYVHYHKVHFQMIYCVKGSIRVVYEGQGPPFWLEPGDCVLQPPEIRHRVLECTDGAEVIEVGMPAIHETWVEHEMTLPTQSVDAQRDFSGQRFARHIAANAVWERSEIEGIEFRDTGIAKATAGRAVVRVFRSPVTEDVAIETTDGTIRMEIRLDESEMLSVVV